MNFVASDEYFSRKGVTLDPLELPDDIDALAEQYFSLTADEWQNFQRAVFWIHTSSTQYDVSWSAAYTSMITAAEALIEVEPSAQCESCGRATGPGPTARFRTFVAEYAPGLATTPEATSLYSLRSALSHGGELLAIDQERSVHAFSPLLWKQRNAADLAGRVVRTALLNWLRSRQRI